MVEDPLHLSTGEVGVNDQAGGGADIVFQAVALQMLADVGGATALPDDGIVNGLTGLFIPDHHGFTLVGNADSGNLIGADVGFRQHFYQR